jgi:hypothetical protein
MLATRSDSDTQIIIALGLFLADEDRGISYRIDRGDPRRFLLILNDSFAHTESVESVVVLHRPRPWEATWILTCVGCGQETEDPGLCGDCSEFDLDDVDIPPGLAGHP